jgi:hypothetical protein
MAIIYRKIESLKTLKKELKKRGITRFNAISEINLFNKQYENEKINIIENTKLEINQEVINIRERIKKTEQELKVLSDDLTNELSNKKERYSKKLIELESKESCAIIGFINRIRHYILNKKLEHITENFDEIIQSELVFLTRKIQDNQSAIDYILNNREEELSKRSKEKIEQLRYIHKALKELYPQISGAIGENLVVKEIEKLPDDYILINDFNLKFEKPIYNKQTGDRIFSVQIDHLLISPAGIFIIETKNWSKESIDNYDLRSPVEQVKRAGYALFVVLNSISHKFYDIGTHHWGESKIPIKNLIVMINNKPNNVFKFVKILRLNELRNYVSRFDKIYSERDVNKIADLLFDFNKSLLIDE